MPPFEDFAMRAPIITRSHDVKVKIEDVDVHNVSVELITEILSEVIKQEGGEVVDGDRLEDLVLDDDEEEDDPDYVQDSDVAEDSPEFKQEGGEVVDGDRLEDLVLDEDEDEDDPDYVEDSDVTEDSLEFKSQIGFEDGDKLADLVLGDDIDDDSDFELDSDVTEDSLECKSQIDFEEEVGYLNYFISQNAYASVVTKSCSDLVEKENLSWTLSNRAQEYVASYGAAQLGIRFIDIGLSVAETPLSRFPSWMSNGVKTTRRHLRAVRRAGIKLNGNACKSSSLLVHMANVFQVNTLLGNIMGIKLADKATYKEHSEEFESDPEYVESSDESEDSLEYRSDVEFAFEEDFDSVSESDDEYDSEAGDSGVTETSEEEEEA